MPRVDSAAKRRSKSTSMLEVQQVRELTGDQPVKEGAEQLKGPHEALVLRLKSRSAKHEAESYRKFLAVYRADNVSSQADEEKLDKLLARTTAKAEAVRKRSEELAAEVAEAERRLEKVNSTSVTRASEIVDDKAMSFLERSQKKIQEDKAEEELEKQREDAQTSYEKVSRRLQNELVELRDFKVLLREYKGVKLQKLQLALGCAKDGRRLRACVREMIRHGAQRILQKLEAADLPLEAWMHEVLVNSCHIEIRIEDSEEKLLQIRREALKPVRTDVQALMSQSKQERFDNLCTRTWDSQFGASPRKNFEEKGNDSGTAQSWPASPQVLQEMRTAEAHIDCLRRLLQDMRHNAAAVICNQIRQVEKSGGREESRDATAWGRQMLSLLVSEEFSKSTMKELQKSAPHAKLTQ